MNHNRWDLNQILTSMSHNYRFGHRKLNHLFRGQYLHSWYSMFWFLTKFIHSQNLDSIPCLDSDRLHQFLRTCHVTSPLVLRETRVLKVSSPQSLEDPQENHQVHIFILYYLTQLWKFKGFRINNKLRQTKTFERFGDLIVTSRLGSGTLYEGRLP